MAEHGRTFRHGDILETKRRFFGKNIEKKFEEQGLKHVDIKNHIEIRSDYLGVGEYIQNYEG